MEQQGQKPQKTLQIIEQWHRQKPGQKIYKIRSYMILNMLKTEQRLRQRYDKLYVQNSSKKINLDKKGNNMEEEQSEMNILDSSSQSTTGALQGSRTAIQQKPINIYQDFKDRGKFNSLRFHFCRAKQRITIIISQKYFLNELKLRQIDLITVFQGFKKVWQQQYFQTMQAFLKLSKDYKNHQFIKLQFVAIDIIGVTFDIAYNNKVGDKIIQLKRFRFRYSPFQFRQNPLFDQKNTQQIMSYLQISSSTVYNISHQDFYNSLRLGFFDDINSSNIEIWRRMITRFWVFYQIHCLNRGTAQFQEFNKKALGRVCFHPIRMKKFQLIFSFPLLNKFIINQKKQATVYLTFYLDNERTMMTQNGLDFKIIVNLVEHHGILTFEHKKQLISRLKREETLSKREESFTILEKIPPLEFNQLFQFQITLKFDEKIGKAFAKIQTIVSFMIDRVAFSDPRSITRQNSEQEIQKILEIYSKPIIFKQNQYVHTHQFCLQLKHKYWTQSGLDNSSQGKSLDSIQFFKLFKKKRKWNQRQKKEEGYEKTEILMNEDLKRYVTQILRTKPLRQCDGEIMRYIQNVAKIVYKPFEDNNFVQKIETREFTLVIIITNIIRLLQLANQNSRKSQIIIITEDNPLLVRGENEDDLIAEITFNIKDLKIYWIKRLPEGHIIIRMFEKHIQVVKDMNWKKTIQIDFSSMENTSNQLIKELKYILTKEIASLQNMMV